MMTFILIIFKLTIFILCKKYQKGILDFLNAMVLGIVLPILLKNINPVVDLRGLPISPIMKLLIALRFYASGCYQV
jgi:hypothetical protein